VATRENRPRAGDPQTLPGEPPLDVTPLGHFYRVVWRWHFYAGLLVVPSLLLDFLVIQRVPVPRRALS
jgi:hypothetical protein